MADESLERWRRASELFDEVRDLDIASRTAHRAPRGGLRLRLRADPTGGRFGGVLADEMASDEDMKSLRGDPEYERLLIAARESENGGP